VGPGPQSNFCRVTWAVADRKPAECEGAAMSRARAVRPMARCPLTGKCLVLSPFNRRDQYHHPPRVQPPRSQSHPQRRSAKGGGPELQPCRRRRFDDDRWIRRQQAWPIRLVERDLTMSRSSSPSSRLIDLRELVCLQQNRSATRYVSRRVLPNEPQFFLLLVTGRDSSAPDVRPSRRSALSPECYMKTAAVLVPDLPVVSAPSCTHLVR